MDAKSVLAQGDGTKVTCLDNNATIEVIGGVDDPDQHVLASFPEKDTKLPAKSFLALYRIKKFSEAAANKSAPAAAKTGDKK